MTGHDASATPRRMPHAKALRVPFVAIGLLLLFAASSGAHFLLNLNVRVLHVEHRNDGLQLFLRTPMPYLVADKIGPDTAEGLPEPAPFTFNARENGKLVHYVVEDALQADPLGLGELAEAGYTLESGGQRLRGAVRAVMLHRVGAEPDYATLEEVLAAFSAGTRLPVIPPPLYVGDTVVDVMIFYPHGAPIRSYALSSQINPHLPGQDDTANLILDYRNGPPKVFRSRGLMLEPVQISHSALAAFSTFVWEGVRHILEGLDHVLFVICLVIGATTLSGLLWRVTGFTLGHSITLALGFFGYVPSGAWFVPAVETGIAVSIIYAAAIAIWSPKGGRGAELSVVAITPAIGLLHGLGFSFVLQKILRVSSPDIWQSLLAFNLGIEAGQLAIVLLIWPVLYLLSRSNPRLWRLSRWVIALGCAAIATVWTVERTAQFLAVLG